MRLRPHNCESSQCIGNVLDPTRRDLLGLAQWSTHCDDCVLMTLRPTFPGRNSLLFSCFSLDIGQIIPGEHFRVGLAAEENSEKCSWRAHLVAPYLVCVDLTSNARPRSDRALISSRSPVRRGRPAGAVTPANRDNRLQAG